MNGIIIIASILLVCGAGLVLWIGSRRIRKTFDTLEDMADRAGAGEDILEVYDESRLSALETKYAHLLSASAISARNVEAEKDKIKTLISDISHQTKTPISNLLLYSELLAEEELPSSARENADAIQKQTEKLRFLIDALVKLSRLENGILQLHPKQEPVQPMLQEICAAYRKKAMAKGLLLILEEKEETAATAFFDPKWTAEAIGNLVDNAIKYTDRGSVAISAAVYEMFLRIDVKDSGIGISEEEQTKIFTRFYRSQTVQDEEGVGVGLYLVREILSAEGGYIKVKSKPGEGSMFSVFLPRE